MEQPELEKAIDDNVQETREMMLKLRLAQTQDKYEEIAEIIRFLIAEYKEQKEQLEKFNEQKTQFQLWLKEQDTKYD